MNVDSSGNLVVSPISARGQERLARLRATIQRQFGSRNNTAVHARGAMKQQQQRGEAHPNQQHSRTKVRQRIQQAARMTADEIFFREFGSPKDLVALDFDLARPEQATVAPGDRDLPLHRAHRTAHTSVVAPHSTSQHTTATHHRIVSTTRTVEPARFAAPSTSVTALAPASTALSLSTAAMRVQEALDRIESRKHEKAKCRTESAAFGASASSYASSVRSRTLTASTAATAAPIASAHERPTTAYVSQLQRPSHITTPKKASLKRPRAPDEPPNAEKALLPLAQKPRLLTDMTATFNNRSFSNVGQARGSSSSVATASSLSSHRASTRLGSGFGSSPVRKTTGFARTSMLQLPSPSKFRAVPPLFGQRQSTAFR